MKRVFERIFVDGMNGMAMGVFITFVLGSILGQIANYVPGVVGGYMGYVSDVAISLMGAGIGVGVCAKFGGMPVDMVAAAVVGMLGAHPIYPVLENPLVTYGQAGDMLCSFLCVIIAVHVGSLFSGKTKMDLLLTPLCMIAVGGVVAYFVGPYTWRFAKWIGQAMNWGMRQTPILMSIVVGVLMGMCMMMPAFAMMLGLMFGINGLAGGAAVIGGCCHLVGFAVMSFNENGVSGLLSQGIGSSVLQFANVLRKPIVWLPPIISSAILAPIGTVLLEMRCTSAGSGAASMGLIGQVATYQAMIGQERLAFVLIKIAVMHFLLPGIFALVISKAMRKMNWIKGGDLTIGV